MKTKAKILIAFSVVILVCLSFFRFGMRQYKVPSSSMENTILFGERILVDESAYGFVNPVTRSPIGNRKVCSRGDVVVFRLPKDPRKLFMKRVIGLPGETIEMREDKVLINQTALSERYAIYNEEFRGLAPETMNSTQIPLDSYFLLGDNRLNSKDSRVYGPIHRNFIVGKATHILMSYDSEEKAFRWDRIGASIH